MEWLKDYWWIILVLLAGIIYNAIKDLKKLNYDEYLKKKNIKPIPYEDDEDDDWPKKKNTPESDSTDDNKQ